MEIYKDRYTSLKRNNDILSQSGKIWMDRAFIDKYRYAIREQNKIRYGIPAYTDSFRAQPIVILEFISFTDAYSPGRTFDLPFQGFCNHTYRHTVGLLWTRDQPFAETSTYTGQQNI
jgi:hypothetical protein